MAMACGSLLGGCGGGGGPAARTTATTVAPSTAATSVTSASPPSTTAPIVPQDTQASPDPGTTSTEAEPGSPAHWFIDPAVPVSDTDTTLHVLVRSLECDGTVERRPLRPGVRVVDGEIRITIDLTPLTGSPNQACTDRTFPAVVDLGMPIGGRPLVDETCLHGGSRWGPNPHEWCVERP